jgi:hypothetical protein
VFHWTRDDTVPQACQNSTCEKLIATEQEPIVTTFAYKDVLSSEVPF